MADCNSPCSGIIIVPSEIDTLQYVQGVNASGCIKFEAPATLVCRILGAALANGEAVPSVTELIGADCRKYTLPTSIESILIANDSPTIDFTQSGSFGHTITAVVKVSATAGNQIVALPDGLFVDTTTADICQILTNLPVIPGAIVPSNARLVFFDPNSLSCYTGTAPTLCAQIGALDTISDLVVPGNAEVVYRRIDGTCGRANLPGGFSASDCSIGALITTTLAPSALVGISAGGCLTQVPNCALFHPTFIGSTAPTTVGSYSLIGRNSGTNCPVIVPPTFHVNDNGINAVAHIALGLTSPNGLLNFTADNNGGLALQVVPAPVTAGALVRISADPTNGWDTLLSDALASDIVKTVGISNTGDLVKYDPANTNCTIGAEVAIASIQAMPGFVVTLGTSNCLTRLSISPRALVFGNINGDHKLAEDATGLLYDPTTRELHLGTSIIPAYSNLGSLVVGNSLSVQNSNYGAVIGTGLTINGGSGNIITGQGHTFAGAAQNNFAVGQGHSLSGALNNNFLGGQGSTATGSNGFAFGVGLEARFCQTVIGRYNTLQGQVATVDGSDYAFMLGTGSSSGSRKLGFAIRYDNCWQGFPQQSFGAQAAIGAQPDDTTAITQLGVTIGTGIGLRGMHAMVLVGGIAEVFFFNGVAWVRAY